MSMDNLEAAETNLGKYVPIHLLNFTGDPNLLHRFRAVIGSNYEKGIVKTAADVCSACSYPLSNMDKIRMRPSHTRSKKISKLLEKHGNGALLGKYKNFALQKFLRSSSHLIIQCSSCQHLNKQPLASNEEKQIIKDKIKMEVATRSKDISKLTASQKKRRRKKNNNKLDQLNNSGLTVVNTPQISFSEQPQSGSAVPMRTPKHKNSNTVSALSTGSHQQHNSLKQIAAGKSTPKSAIKSQTPLSRNEHGFGGNQQTVKRSDGRLKQKGLKQFLEQGQESAKKSSLADFLSSL